MEIKVIKENFSEMAFVEQAAYAGSFKGTKEERKELEDIFKSLTEKGDITAYGAYDKTLMGCLLHYDFLTNFHGQMIRTAGIGSLAVDLLHKKKKVANHLILDSIERARQAGVILYYLYPFNVKFYRNFGFGYGAPMYTYTARPQDFKDMGSRELLSYADENDFDHIVDFYNQQAKVTHGMSLKTSGGRNRLERMKQAKIIVAKDETGLLGYMIYTQKSVSQEDNQAQKILVSEMIYTKEALLAFSSFFHAQKDQVNYIQYATHDPSFQYILDDTTYAAGVKTMDIIALKSSEQAFGLMPLVLDPQKLLNTLGASLDYQIDFTISHPKADEKKASIGQGDLVTINLAINEFSSWITGAVTLDSLWHKGLLETNRQDLLRQLDQTFYFESPISYTRF